MRNMTMFKSARVATSAATLMFSVPLHAHDRATHAAGPSALTPSAKGAAATVDAFHSALRRGDTKGAAAILAEDALIFESGAVERSKPEYASHHLAADAEFSRAVPSVLSSRVGSAVGSMAWIASEGRTTGTYKGKPLDLMTTETMLLRRTGVAWKIVHIHWSSGKAVTK
jgi:ketosteroid isomerase-like protein